MPDDDDQRQAAHSLWEYGLAVLTAMDDDQLAAVASVLDLYADALQFRTSGWSTLQTRVRGVLDVLGVPEIELEVDVESRSTFATAGAILSYLSLGQRLRPADLPSEPAKVTQIRAVHGVTLSRLSRFAVLGARDWRSVTGTPMTQLPSGDPFIRLEITRFDGAEFEIEMALDSALRFISRVSAEVEDLFEAVEATLPEGESVEEWVRENASPEDVLNLFQHVNAITAHLEQHLGAAEDEGDETDNPSPGSPTPTIDATDPEAGA